MNAKFNYSTHSVSKRNEIEDYLKAQNLTFSIKETRDPDTDLTTHLFCITTSLEGPESFGKVREFQKAIKDILQK